MRKKNIIQFSILIAFLITWSILLLTIGTTKIVEFIGISNTYFVLFIVGTLGGVSTITSSSFYTTLTTFANGGANPIYLGIFGGIGITIGDTLFYYLGKKGEESLPKNARKFTRKFSEWMMKRPKWVIPIVTFVYSGLTPLPNDILAVSLGISRYKYKYIIIPLLLGNILLTTFVALIAGRVLF
ncbi:MAG: VTT domain-containing protein [Candidatus Nanoarchaeia archaeon]